ncbi:unnamed protein product, partial [Candidula unifasciata]
GAEAIVRQAREWETSGEHQRAVECYLKVTPDMVADTKIVEKCLMKAGDIAIKFLDNTKAQMIVQAIGPRLAEIKCHSTAAEMYLSMDMGQEAIDMLISAGDWNKAKKVAKEMEPRLETYVDEKYKEFCRDQGKAEDRAVFDVIGGLGFWDERKGEWSKCIQTAELQNPKVLHKYLALYATHLIKNNNSLAALQLYAKYGTIANPQCENLGKSSSANTSQHDEFETMLLIAHYYATRSAALAQPSLESIAGKLSVSLLRHTDVVPADKAFYEAGMLCKSLGWENMAFVFLNRYLDISEAMEEGTLDMLDHSDFQDTDIPFEIPIPEKPFLTSQQHEEVKEWVLAVSMDRKVKQDLPKDERGTYEASLVAADSGIRSLPCVVTGYPVLKNQMEFKNANKVANKEDWNKLLMATKVSHSTELQDVLKFIATWCGTSPSFSFQ